MFLKRLVFSLLVATAGQAHVSAQVERSTTYLVKDLQSKEWCSFSDISDWRSKRDSLEASTVGAINYLKGKIVEVDLTDTDEAGDWTIYDRYFVQGGRLYRLIRKINTLTYGRSVEDRYSISNKVWKRERRVETDLHTGKLLSNSNGNWLPKQRMFDRLEELPFYHLLKTSNHENEEPACSPEATPFP